MLLLELLLPPLPAAGNPTPEIATEALSSPGIKELGYDAAWVTPAQPAPITIPEPQGGGGGGDPSVEARQEFIPEAPLAGRSEVLEWRTQNSRTFVNADGTFTQERAEGKMNFRAADGTWQPMDLRLVTDAAGDYAYRVAANDVTVRIGADDAETALAELSDGTDTLSLRAIGYDEGASSPEVRLMSQFAKTFPMQYAAMRGLDAGRLVPRVAADGQTILLFEPPAAGPQMAMPFGLTRAAPGAPSA